jgi:hypothetical protein
MVGMKERPRIYDRILETHFKESRSGSFAIGRGSLMRVRGPKRLSDATC